MPILLPGALVVAPDFISAPVMSLLPEKVVISVLKPVPVVPVSSVDVVDSDSSA